MDTILLVDDDPAIRELFAIFLKMAGYRPLTVSGGRACLDLLKTEVPDLMVLDLMMEPMDGWETLFAITGTPSSRVVPVVVITGKQPVPEDIQQYGGYIWDYLVKPVDIEKVVASFPAVIEKDRVLRREIDSAKDRGEDPELTREYAFLRRLVTVVHNLDKRRRKHAWTNTVPVEKQEERLHYLQKKLGFPDILNEPGEGG